MSALPSSLTAEDCLSPFYALPRLWYCDENMDFERRIQKLWNKWGLVSFMKSQLIALAVFAILAILFCFPILKGITNWGILDWDQHTFYHAVPRETILRYHQFPLWNPYYCGGNVMLANMQARFLSPTFILLLLFGTLPGLKIEIIFQIMIGMWGMYLLCRHLGLGKYASYFPAIVFMCNGRFVLHLTEGQTWFMPIAYLPFVVLFYLKSIKQIKYGLLSGAFLGLMILEGGVYPAPHTALFLGLTTRDVKGKSKFLELKWNEQFHHIHNNLNYGPWSAMYPAFLRNEGTLNGYEPTHFPTRALAYNDPNYRGEVFFIGTEQNNETKVHLLYWSPNKIIANVTNASAVPSLPRCDDTSTPSAQAFRVGTLVLNQNFAKDWKAISTVPKRVRRPVESYNGLVSTHLFVGDKQIVFYYLPVSFIIGCVITIGTIIGSLLLFRLRKIWTR